MTSSETLQTQLPDGVNTPRDPNQPGNGPIGQPDGPRPGTSTDQPDGGAPPDDEDAPINNGV